MSNPTPEPVEALRRAIDAAVRQALDTPEFHQAVDEAVKQFLADSPNGGGNVARDIERAVAWPVNQAIAETLGFDTLAQGTHPEVLRVNNAMQAVSGPIESAVRDTVRRATRRD